MTIIITLFYSSLLTIVGTVVWKLVVLRASKLSLIEGIERDLYSKLHGSLHGGWRILREKYLSRVASFAVALFYTVAHEVLRYTLIWGQKLKARHRKLFDMVKGKGIVRKKGSVSFFLQDVAEYKKSMRTGGEKEVDSL